MPAKNSSNRTTERRTPKSKPAKKNPSKPTTATSPTRTPLDKPAQEPLYFWRPKDPNSPLCQWTHTPFTCPSDPSVYATAEMWMMLHKARLFNDTETEERMLETTDPKMHKFMERAVRGFDEGVWERERMRVVEEGNWWKFTRGVVGEGDDWGEWSGMEGIREMGEGGLRWWLLGTGERELVEASPQDRVWGIGFTAENAERNRKRWGLNLLGKALMNVRRRLREEEERRDSKVEEGDVRAAEGLVGQEGKQTL